MLNRALARKIALGAGATISLLGIFLVLAEFGLRQLKPIPVTVHSPGLYESDSPRRFRLSPNYQGTLSNVYEFSTSISVNSDGLRGAPLKPTGDKAFRLLVIGDSFAFGWGVEEEETFVAHLGKQFQVDIPQFEILNAGVPGFSVVDSVDWLEYYGPELEPDLVLLAVCLANDLLDANENRRLEELPNVPSAGPSGGLELWLYKNSHLMRWSVRAPSVGWMRSLLGLPEPWSITFARDMIRVHTDDLSSALAREGRERSSAALARFVDLGDQHGFRVAAILIPAEFHTNVDYWNMALAHFGLDSGAYDAHAPARFFSEALIKYDIPSLNMTSSVVEGAKHGERLYYPADGHWTAAGHLLASKVIRDFLLMEGLLSEDGMGQIDGPN